MAKLRLWAQRLGAGVCGHPPVQSKVLMVLSWNCVLVYVLRETGVRGRLTSGRIELEASKGLRVYSSGGSLNEYISGARLRSCRVFLPGNATFRLEPSYARGCRPTSQGSILSITHRPAPATDRRIGTSATLDLSTPNRAATGLSTPVPLEYRHDYSVRIADRYD